MAINPFNGESLPVWVANYVLTGYGTGAVMSVPAHDERDFEFAQKYSLPIRQVIAPITHDQPQAEPVSKIADESVEMHQAFTEYGVLINSGEWGGKLCDDAIREMAEYAEKNGFGGGRPSLIAFAIGVSRASVSGARRFPIIYCDDCGMVPVPHGTVAGGAARDR